MLLWCTAWHSQLDCVSMSPSWYTLRKSKIFRAWCIISFNITYMSNGLTNTASYKTLISRTSSYETVTFLIPSPSSSPSLLDPLLRSSFSQHYIFKNEPQRNVLELSIFKYLHWTKAQVKLHFYLEMLLQLLFMLFCELCLLRLKVLQ